MLDLLVLAVRAANADANEDVVFQDVDCSSHAVRGPIRGLADAVDFLRRLTSLAFFVLLQTFLLPLVARFLFFLLFAFRGIRPTSECLLPKVPWVFRLWRTGIALRHCEADRFIERLGRVKALRDPITVVGILASFNVLDWPTLDLLDLVFGNQTAGVDLRSVRGRGRFVLRRPG